MSASKIAQAVAKDTLEERLNEYLDTANFLWIIFLVHLSIWAVHSFIGHVLDFVNCGIIDPPPPFKALEQAWTLLKPNQRFMMRKFTPMLMILCIWAVTGWSMLISFGKASGTEDG
ncbi:hypothetical protein ONS95_007528 [Cadophora gregata]|uniref:uncharacterized protein n=1 Tax=Cadophora gregata TaxID=51156 RepID=UPI0026DC3E28|nr:uncharacterized protein ONS95_007528 [Cadophora gregata]KAK0118646.1 hypothetical protein ONS96_011734 [Cadophora gregata f. sp. sojae]KAK0125904.1 hypothetical protein ONS95_007528 [Cadophora gregata]